MTFEYQLPRELESFAQDARGDLLQLLIQESTLLHTHTLSDREDIPLSRRQIWHYSLSDRGYTLFSLSEPDIIAVLNYWNVRMGFQKEHGF